MDGKPIFRNYSPPTRILKEAARSDGKIINYFDLTNEMKVSSSLGSTSKKVMTSTVAAQSVP